MCCCFFKYCSDVALNSGWGLVFEVGVHHDSDSLRKNLTELFVEGSGEKNKTNVERAVTQNQISQSIDTFTSFLSSTFLF